MSSSNLIRWSGLPVILAGVAYPLSWIADLFIESPNSTLREWMDDQRGKSVLGSFIQELPSQVQAEFGGMEGEVIGMDTTSFFMDMPLSDRLYFLDFDWSKSPEEIVDELLSKVYGIDK